MTTPVQPSSGPPQNYTPYQKHLWSMAQRIKARGGSPADFADYVRHAEDRPGLRVAVEPPTEDPVEIPGIGRGLVMNVVQGATFGFGDEALGSIWGLANSGETAQSGRDLYRQQLAAFRQQHGNLANVAQFAGGFLVPLGAAGVGFKTAVRGLSKAATVLVGAGAGAVAGAGEATGGLSDRAKAALVGAGFGAAIGGVGAPLVAGLARGAGSIASKVVSWLGPRFSSMAEHLPGAPARAARTMLAEALERDGLSGRQAATRIAHRASKGLPTTVADVGQTNVMDLAQTAARMRGPQQQQFAQAIAERASTQNQDLLEEVGRASRLGLQNVYDLAPQMEAHYRRMADPLYREAFQQEVRLTPNIRKMLQEPDWRAAYERGRIIAMQEDASGLARGLPVPLLFTRLPTGVISFGGVGSKTAAVSATPGPLSGVFTRQTEDFIPSTLPLRALDYLKRGINAMEERLGAEARPPLDRQTATAMRARLSTVLGEIDDQVPVYGQARAVAEKFFDNRDALEAGSTGFLTKPPRLIAQEMAASSSPTMYRIGALQAVADALSGSGPGAGNFKRMLMGTSLYSPHGKAMLDRIRLLVKEPQAAQELIDRIAGEAAVTRTGQKLGRIGGAAPDQAARQLVPPTGVVGALRERVGIRKAPTARAQAVADELTRLFAKGIDDPHELVQELAGLDRFILRGRAVNVGLKVGLGGVAAPTR